MDDSNVLHKKIAVNHQTSIKNVLFGVPGEVYIISHLKLAGPRAPGPCLWLILQAPLSMEAQLNSVEAQPHEHFSAPFENIEEELKMVSLLEKT